MGVWPKFWPATGTRCSFIQETFPLRLPRFEEKKKLGLRTFHKTKRQRSQFYSRLRLRFLGQIPRHDFDLMKLTHLYWNAFKNPCHASFSIDHGPRDRPACSLKRTKTLLIHARRLFRHFLPPEISLERRRTKDADPVMSPPKGHIGGNHRGLGNPGCMGRNGMGNLPAYPPGTVSGPRRKLCKRLSPPHVGMEKPRPSLLPSSHGLEGKSTRVTMVALDPLFPVFPGMT